MPPPCNASRPDGNAEAQYRLGLAYLQGSGVKRDDAEAARWLRDAARHGHEQAPLVLKERLGLDPA